MNRVIPLITYLVRDCTEAIVLFHNGVALYQNRR